MTVQDYGVTYDELEPHFDRFEKICGISGKAGNLGGEIVEGGNPFEGWRSDEYPNPPLEMTFAQHRFEAAANGAWPHPFPAPAANMSRATPTRWVSSSRPAPIAASARNSVAATSRSRARRRPSSRC
jgi:choline dehydrogenase-like flavoprotein